MNWTSVINMKAVYLTDEEINIIIERRNGIMIKEINKKQKENRRLKKEINKRNRILKQPLDFPDVSDTEDADEKDETEGADPNDDLVRV